MRSLNEMLVGRFRARATLCCIHFQFIDGKRMQTYKFHSLGGTEYGVLRTESPSSPWHGIELVLITILRSVNGYGAMISCAWRQHRWHSCLCLLRIQRIFFCFDFPDISNRNAQWKKHSYEIMNEIKVKIQKTKRKIILERMGRWFFRQKKRLDLYRSCEVFHMIASWVQLVHLYVRWTFISLHDHLRRYFDSTIFCDFRWKHLNARL